MQRNDHRSVAQRNFRCGSTALISTTTQTTTITTTVVRFVARD